MESLQGFDTTVIYSPGRQRTQKDRQKAGPINSKVGLDSDTCQTTHSFRLFQKH